MSSESTKDTTAGRPACRHTACTVLSIEIISWLCYSETSKQNETLRFS